MFKNFRDYPKKVQNTLKAFLLIVACITAYMTLRGYFKTDKQQFDEDHTIQGKITSPQISKVIRQQPNENYSVLSTVPVLDEISSATRTPKVKGIHIEGLSKRAPDDSLVVRLGIFLQKICIQDLYKGVRLRPFCIEMTSSYSLIAIKDYLFASAEFWDIETDHLIGNLEFNHWKIYKGEFKDYQNDDKKIEVRDLSGNIVFSFGYRSAPNPELVAIAGYLKEPQMIGLFVNKTIVDKNREMNQVVPCQGSNDSNWKRHALNEIRRIKSIFPSGVENINLLEGNDSVFIIRPTHQ